MEKVYVFGHRKPDTDSVCGAIALAYLKKQLGLNCEPVILSDINCETKFVLDKFKIDTPAFLNDVKLKIKSVKYKKNVIVSKDDSLFNVYNVMIKNNFNRVAVVDDEKKLIGTIGMKNIAKFLIESDTNKINSTYDYIEESLNGKSILKYDDNIVGDLLVASFKSTTFISDVKLNRNSILIVGDRHSIIEYAVNSAIKLLILSGDAEIKKEHLKIAKKNKVSIIRVSSDTLTTVQKIALSNIIDLEYVDKNVISVDENDSLDDFNVFVNKYRHTYYPVIDINSRCLGIITLSDLSEKKRKKVILVDHNSYEQSIEGIEDADILEIIDHHNIGSIVSSRPINFRNMPVGSSNTIIYQMFKENGIKIPTYIAGLMASGIISDTLILNSPTTTEIDKNALKDLSKIAKVDYKKYGLEMLKAGASLNGKTKEELIYQDFKSYPYDDMKLGVGQLSTTNPEVILDDIDEYVDALNRLSEENGYRIMALFVTDILNNGSYVIFNSSASDILGCSFRVKKFKEGTFLKGVVSRKLQVIPAIIEN